MNVIAKLFGLKTATEFARVLPELEADLATARGRLARLKDQIRTAPFEAGESEVKRLRQEIRDIEDDVETLVGVIDETNGRHRAAQEADADLQTRQELAAASQTMKALKSDFRALDDHIAAIREILSRSKDGIGQAHRANAKAGVDDNSYSKRTPPKFWDERVPVPHVNFAFLEEAVSALAKHSLTTWFDAMVEKGKFK